MNQKKIKLQVQNLRKVYDEKCALEGATFDIYDGEFLSILGPSGCGKTTILRILIGLLNATSGTVHKDGRDITNAHPSDRGMGIVFQNYALFENMTVLGYGSKVYSNKAYVESGYVLVAETETHNVDTLASNRYVYDAEKGAIVYNFEFVSTPMTTNYTVKKCSEVENSITDARLSMLYYTNFNMMLYIPVKDGMTISSFGGFEASAETVKIDGNEYYAYKRASSTAGAADTVVSSVVYSVGDVEYKQTFRVSALVYAELILTYPEAEAESKAVANMVRYIKEARTASALDIPEKITELEALYTLDGYKAAADYDDLDVDYYSLAGAEISFLVNGTYSSYLLKLPVASFAGAENAQVSVKFVGGGEIDGIGQFVEATDTKGAYYRFITTNTRVYDVAEKAIEITVTLPGAEPIVATYSIGAYINATNNTLVKAMYEFGIAAKEYRSYLKSL